MRGEDAHRAKRSVIVWRSEVLPYSETFIKEQLLFCTNWKGTLAGWQPRPGLSLDGVDVRTFASAAPGFAERAKLLLHRLRGTMPSAVVSTLGAEKPLLVHAHFGPDAVIAWPLAKALSVPLMVTLHGYDITIRREWWEAGNAGPTMTRYPRELLKLATKPHVHFIAVSNAIKSAAVAYGISAEKITTCYIGVDTQRHRPRGAPIAAREHRILFVGRLVEKKGCAYLLEAMRKVALHVPSAKLVIAGDGPLRSDLVSRAEQYGVPVDFCGKLTPDEVSAEMSRARVFCLPSVTTPNGDAEGFGLVLLEAGAAGLPVVTSARGGAQEGVIDGQTGFSIGERDVNGLSEKLIGLLTDDEAAMRIGSRARQFVTRHFDIRSCTAQLETHYDELAGRCPQTYKHNAA